MVYAAAATEVVISLAVEDPLETGDDADLAAANASRARSPFTSRIFAFMCEVSVMIPT